MFSLKVVTRETGISASTLRAWERRYGLPRPQRTSSGRRLYSRRDIETIRWLTQRVAEGMSIGQAVELWRKMEANGQDPLRFPFSLKAEMLPATAELNSLRQAWLNAVLNFNEEAADFVLNQAFAIYPPETVCLEVLLWGLREIGDLWYAGKVAVAHEHFASSVATRRLEALIQAAPSPNRPGCVLVLAPPVENHSFSLRLLAYLLHRRGWHVVYLGGCVPLERFRETLRAIKPDRVITAIQYTAAVAGLMDLAHLLKAEGIPLGYGGRVFNLLPTLCSRIPGYFLGKDLKEALPQIEQWIAESLPPLEVEPISESWQQALDLFQAQEMEIWGVVLLTMTKRGMAFEWLSDFMEEFNLHLKSAMMTGEMGLMDYYLSWLQGLHSGYFVTREWLYQFLLIYAETLMHQVGPVVAFLCDYFRGKAKS